MNMPLIDPEAFSQAEEYREGPLADDPPSHVELDTDDAGIEEAPPLSPEAVEQLRDH